MVEQEVSGAGEGGEGVDPGVRSPEVVRVFYWGDPGDIGHDDVDDDDTDDFGSGGGDGYSDPGGYADPSDHSDSGDYSAPGGYGGGGDDSIGGFFGGIADAIGGIFGGGGGDQWGGDENAVEDVGVAQDHSLGFGFEFDEDTTDIALDQAVFANSMAMDSGMSPGFTSAVMNNMSVFSIPSMIASIGQGLGGFFGSFEDVEYSYPNDDISGGPDVTDTPRQASRPAPKPMTRAPTAGAGQKSASVFDSGSSTGGGGSSSPSVGVLQRSYDFTSPYQNLQPRVPTLGTGTVSIPEEELDGAWAWV